MFDWLVEAGGKVAVWLVVWLALAGLVNLVRWLFGTKGKP